jgi:AAA family ATP:ADP antiporter
VFDMMIVAQFWGFANDLYTKDEGERLFAIVGFGASLGAVLGAVVAGWLIAPLGLDQLLLVGAGLLVAQAALTNYVDTRESARDDAPSADAATPPAPEAKQRASAGRSAWSSAPHTCSFSASCSCA